MTIKPVPVVGAAEAGVFREPTFEEDCLHWRGRLLTGKHAHWCWDWDGLPIDETTPEWPCDCFKAGLFEMAT